MLSMALSHRAAETSAHLVRAVTDRTWGLMVLDEVSALVWQRVAVAGWQWVGWTGNVTAVILSGDKLGIG
jgi:hypothetical protein